MGRALRVLLIAGIGVAAADARADDFFEAKVRPILLQRCEKCHGAQKAKSGLRLDLRAGWERGGSQGRAVVPGKPEESLLVQAIRYGDPDLRMPPDARLPDTEVATLVEWVKRGAVDPRDGGGVRLNGPTLEEARRWWSFRPVERPTTPPVPAGTRPGSAIDAYILARAPAGAPATSAPADRRTLIRRATYDLTGLPPSAGEVDDFLGDTAPNAFERVIDRLLASPAYGEQWGRHWLDVVRYADTAGENTDRPLPEAWRYRNWVVDALNRDMPYDEFIRDQVAGDLLAAEGTAEKYAERVVATGYLAIARRFGHDIEKDVHLTHDDVIDTLGKSILGLTLGCARCHSHKYDPISVEDYYALYGIFDSTRYPFPGCEPKPQPRDLVPLATPEAWKLRIQPYEQGKAALAEELGRLVREEDEIALRLEPSTDRPARILTTASIDEGQAADLKAAATVEPGSLVRLVIDPRGNHGADSTLVRLSIGETQGAHRLWDLTKDATANLLAGNPLADGIGNARVWWFLSQKNGPRLLNEAVHNLEGKPGLDAWRLGDTPSVFVNSSDSAIQVWTTLPPRTLFAHPGESGPVVIAWRSPTSGPVEVVAHVADAHKGGPSGVAARLELVNGTSHDDLSALARIAGRTAEIARRRSQLQAQEPRPEVAFAVAEGKPHDARVLLRGEPEKPGMVVKRRWLSLFGGSPLPATAGSGRRELAGWLTDPGNPLTPRVMVNRVWQYHFGHGLVRTPNDFGTRGQLPTHPELLDWLAGEFVRSGWRIKPLHRQIMLSDAYQRSSASAPDTDPRNERLQRFERRRLSAEEFRDSLLLVSGRLDRSPGGRHPFPPEKGWAYTQHNPFAESYPTDRRTLYLMAKRNRRDAFLATFDGADPNASTPERQVTTVPTQALFFMNDPFFHEQADGFAERLSVHRDPRDRLVAAFRSAFQREPNEAEKSWAARFLADYGAEVTGANASQAAWAALARILLSSNEYLYLD